MVAAKQCNGMRKRLVWCFGLAGIALSAAACGSPDPQVKVVMTEMAYEPSQITIQRGQKTIFLLENKGTSEHNLAVQRQPITSANVAPGQTGRLEVALPPGNYAIICTIPGHEEMTGQITATRGR
jgi:uncharacterized cupredoxin-like copper-binding protein